MRSIEKYSRSILVAAWTCIIWASKLEDVIDHRSGLLGISGLSSDMRRLHEAASTCVD